MRASPPGLLIESLLVTLNTVPTGVVGPVVRAQGFDDVRSFAITTLATMNSEVFDAHDLPANSYYVLLSDERQFNASSNLPGRRDKKARRSRFALPK